MCSLRQLTSIVLSLVWVVACDPALEGPFTPTTLNPRGAYLGFTFTELADEAYRARDHRMKQPGWSCQRELETRQLMKEDLWGRKIERTCLSPTAVRFVLTALAAHPQANHEVEVVYDGTTDRTRVTIGDALLYDGPSEGGDGVKWRHSRLLDPDIYDRFCALTGSC